MKIATKIVALVTSVVILASIGIVSATWYYSGNAVDPEYESVEIDMGNNWETTNLLLADIIDLLNKSDSSLNDNIEARQEGSSSNIILVLLRLIFGWATYEGRSYYGSMDPTASSSIDSIIEDFLNKNPNYSYIIDFSQKSSNIMYIYISDTKLGNMGASSSSGILWNTTYYNSTEGSPTVPIGANIYHIYRTTLNYNSNDGWYAVNDETMVDGYAPSCWYEEQMADYATVRQVPSYDINSWKPIDDDHTQGDSVSTAIWTFKGDNPAVTVTDNTTPVYYQLQTSSVTYCYTYSDDSNMFSYYGLEKDGSNRTAYNYFYDYTDGSTASTTHSYAYNAEGSYTITASDSNVGIIVYSDSSLGTVVASNFNGNVITGDSVTFAASEATTYYIQVYGATEFTLNVELTG